MSNNQNNFNNRNRNGLPYDPDFDEPFDRNAVPEIGGGRRDAGTAGIGRGGTGAFDDFSGKGPEPDGFGELDGFEDLGTPGTKSFGTSKTEGPGDVFGDRTPRKKARELNTADSVVSSEKLKDERAKSRKSKIRKIIVFAVLEVFTLAAIFTYGYFLRAWNLITRPEVDENVIENKNISLAKKQEMEQGYWTVAVFGVDGRDASDLVSKGLNSDVIIIVNINQDTGEIRMCSVYRDTYLNISDKDSYRKINAAYCNGGPEQALAALNKNLDLNIKNYVTFNWKAVADGINILGGVDGIDISKAEFYYINAFITETVEVTGIGSHHLTAPGSQHLDGVQAVAYGRLRLMDSDFARVERQKKIIKACFDKAKTAGFSVLNNIMVVCFPEVATNIGFNDVVAMAQNITKYEITEAGGFPWQRSTPAVSGVGDVVVPATLESNVKLLHRFLFDDENYEPSSAVIRYSETIKEKTGIYKEGQVVESVRTDGGLVSKPKTSEASSQTASESRESEETETDENGNVIERATIGIDENGNYVYPTDADGNIVLPKDSEGNVLFPTDEYGNIIYETDADGNVVNPTDAEGNTLTYPDARPTELEEGGESRPGETSHADDLSQYSGPGDRAGSNKKNSSTGDNAPGTGTTAATQEAAGPGRNQETTASGGTQSETPGSAVPGGSTQESTGSVGPVMETSASNNLAPGSMEGPGAGDAPGGTEDSGNTENPPGGTENVPGGGSVPGGSGSIGAPGENSNAPGGSSGGNTPGGSSGGNTPGGSSADVPGGTENSVSGGDSPGSAPG